MIGFCRIEKFLDAKDSAGAETQAIVRSEMDENIKAIVYLPPFVRKTQCEIAVGSKVLAVIDDVSGIGAVMVGIDGADFKYFFDANINIKKSLDVQNDIKSMAGDVKAENVSLKNHIHRVSMVTAADAAAIAEAATTGLPAETSMMTGGSL